MAKVRRVIRKIQPAANRYFDEQFWPVVVALFVLGGFLLGLIFAYLTDHFLFWPSLILLPIVIGATIAMLRYVSNRTIKRSMQLALVISIIIHLAILVSTQQEVFRKYFKTTPDFADLVRERRFEVTVPDYTRLRKRPDQKKDFEKLVETTTPEPEPERLDKKEPEPEQPRQRPQPTPVPEPEKTIRPNVVKKRELTETAPRQTEQPSKLSRQRNRAEPKSGTAADVPRAAQRLPQPARLQPRATPVQRRAARQPFQRRAAAEAPSTITENQLLKIARKQPQQAPKPETTKAPTLKRRLREPRLTPRTSVASIRVPSQPKQKSQAIQPAPVAQSKQTTSPAIQPKATSAPERPIRVARRRPPRRERADRRPTVARTPIAVDNRRTRTTSRPNLDTLVDLPNPTAAPRKSPRQPTSLAAQASPLKRAAAPAAITAGVQPQQTAAPRSALTEAQMARASARPVARRRPRADRAPQTATARRSIDRRRTSITVLPGPSAAAATVATSKAPTRANPPAPRPSSSLVSRQPASRPTATRSQRSLEMQLASPSTQLASVSRHQARSVRSPSMNAQVRPSKTVARSSQLAARPSSPTSAQSPAAAVVRRGIGNPTIQPARTALAKSLTGLAGIGQSENVDRALPSGISPALAASNSANRRRATQNSPAGPAFSPTQPAQISRTAADLQVPSASLAATEPKVATRPGAKRPAPINATASAALTYASSDADKGPVAAAKGTAEVDLGPPKVVADHAAGRASGGGQPVINFQSQSRGLARTETGGAPQVALAAATVDELPKAPAGSEGGRPTTRELNPQASALARMESGGAEPISGGPTTAMLKGPSAELSTAELLADSSVHRTEAAEAAPGSPEAGGGVPKLDQEQEKHKLLARRSLRGTAQLALAAPQAQLPTSASSASADRAARSLEASQTPIARRQEGVGQIAAGAAASAAALLAALGGGERIAKAQLGRAEAVEAAPGEPVVGGGTGSTSRSLANVAVASSVKAESIARAGRPQSSGLAELPPLDAQGAEVTRFAGGAAGPTISGPVGALTGQTIVAASSGTVPGVAIGVRQTSPSAVEGPALAAATNAGAPLPKAATLNLPVGTATEVAAELPQVGAEPSSVSAAEDLLASADIGSLSRQPTGGLLASLPAIDGPAGLGTEYAPDAGMNNRRARPDSELVLPIATSRFKRSDPGGRLNTSMAAIVATEAYRGRQRDRQGSSGSGRPSPQTERAIDLGLLFLHRHQSPDGSWSFNNFGAGRRGYEQELAMLNSDTAATGLALLAFQGAGYDHMRYKYADVVRQGLQWLLKNQKPNGDLYVKLDETSHASVWLYSHSIATIALCEAYGMTQDPQLRGPAQKAIDFIVATQNRQLGGWRYAPQRSSDTSVTGWMMMALYSGDLANLEVPKETYTKIQHWLDLAQKSQTERHLYCYNPLAPDTLRQRHGRRPSLTMTSVGLLMRLYSGWRRDNLYMIKGADYLLENLPTYGTPRNPKRDTYYWYYATQVMAHMGGDYWKKWDARLHPLLINTQTPYGPMAGSWNPRGPIPDRWGPHAGRLYVTTMNLLSLEVQYRKLPLYEETAK